jgi:hypothetical protein
MTTRRASAGTVAAVAAACAIAVGGTSAASAAPNRGLPQGSEAVRVVPADFSTVIDNPYWPMRPGSRCVHRETDTTGATKAAGRPVEITDDWYAQDRAGNVWYLGEATREYRDGRVVSRAGSFEAGVDGAQAGIAVPANPVPGLS